MSLLTRRNPGIRFRFSLLFVGSNPVAALSATGRDCPSPAVGSATRLPGLLLAVGSTHFFLGSPAGITTLSWGAVGFLLVNCARSGLRVYEG